MSHLLIYFDRRRDVLVYIVIELRQQHERPCALGRRLCEAAQQLQGTVVVLLHLDEELRGVRHYVLV